LSDAIQEVIDTLSELKRLHQLNFELLEQLNVVCQWILDNHTHIPNEGKLRSLLSKSLALLSEIHADTPKTLIYQKLSDGSYHGNESDDKLPEPVCRFC